MEILLNGELKEVKKTNHFLPYKQIKVKVWEKQHVI